MSGVYGFSREAVRVKVKKCEGVLQPEFRKFSVDPQITSFEVLQSILAKAFDIKGEFTICYRTFDVSGSEIYLPLLSDWDLEAAFLKAHNIPSNTEPCLCLRVDLKPFEECSDDWEIRANVPVITQIRTTNATEVKSTQRLHGIFNQMGKTLNMVQRAFNFGEDGSASQQPPRPPVSDSEFRRFLDPVGQIVHAKDLRSVIYFGGIDPSLRKVVWKHILNVYPDGMTGRERMDYIRKKAAEYVSLKETWKTAIARGPVVGELAYTTGMVRKDVLRTDRHHPFYAGSDDNQNIASLFNILTTYALNHPKVSYCQGMSDLASPLLVTMGDEAHAYICFCALMSRLSTNFMLDGIAMTQKFTHLAEGLLHYDPEFYNYLKSHQADDLLFCYRWLLLEMKREFAFDDSLRMLEVLWSSLPADPPLKELKLFDVLFQPAPIATPPISPLVKTPRENAYTKVCALRRQSSSISLVSYSGKKVPVVKRQNHSLDETITRCNIVETKVKHQSLDDTSLMKQKALLGSKESVPNSPRKSTSGSESPPRDDVSPINKTGNELSPFPPNSPKSPKGELRPRSVSPLEQKSDSVVYNNRINHHKTFVKSRSTSLSSSMTNLIKNSKKTGHFKDLKDRIAAGKIFSSLDTLDSTHSIKEEPEQRPKSGKMVKNLNEFLNFAAGGHRSSKIGVDKIRINSAGDAGNDKPKIMLTKSSFDDSESSSLDRNSSVRRLSSTSNSCDDTFDECSPDDSQEYFPMTTSVTRELRIELENLDRQVFGNKYHEKLLESDSPSSDCASEAQTKCNYELDDTKCNYELEDTLSTDKDCSFGIRKQPSPKMNLKLGTKKFSEDGKKVEDLDKVDGVDEVDSTTVKRTKNDDVFVWENPLHQTSPKLPIKPSFVPTPDEQADLEYDAELGQIVDESSATKTITPIKILHSTSLNKVGKSNSPSISEAKVNSESPVVNNPFVESSSGNSKSSDKSLSLDQMKFDNSVKYDNPLKFDNSRKFDGSVTIDHKFDDAVKLENAKCDGSIKLDNVKLDNAHVKLDSIKSDNVRLDNNIKSEGLYKLENSTLNSVKMETSFKSDVNGAPMTNSCEEITENIRTLTMLPPPNEFGGGNPFLMFLCITVLLQHREQIMGKGMDYNEMAMHFDKMVRKHNVTKVLNQARQMYARYIKQHTMAQQKLIGRNEDC